MKHTTNSKPLHFGCLLLFILLPWLNPVAPNPAPAVVPLLFTWFCFAIFLVLCLRVPGRADKDFVVSSVVWACVLAGLISSVVGLCQYMGLSTGNRLWPWIVETKLGQAISNLRQPNQFATLTNIALAALLWLVTRERLPQRNAWALALLAGALLSLGNAASSSRTGMLQLPLLCGLAFLWGLWRHRLARAVLLSAVLVYALGLVALPWLAGLDLTQHGMFARLRAGDPLCASRLTLWSNVLHMVAQKPWLGWGWDELGYAQYTTTFSGPRFCQLLDNAHNLPLHLAVTLGIPAAALLTGGFCVWVGWQQPWRETDRSRQLAWAVLAVILLHSLLEYPLWYGPFQIAALLCMALLMWPQQGQLAAKTKRVLCACTGLGALLVMVFCSYATWDYQRISQIYFPPEQRAAPFRDDTLEKIRGSRLFHRTVGFAELTITPLTPENAQWTFATAQDILHYSAEPRVIEKLLESAALLGRTDDFKRHAKLYEAAFPKDYTRWLKARPANTKARISR